MSRRPAFLFLSAAAWLGFVAVTLWAVAFLAGVVVPWTVDGPARTTTARAVAVDLALLLLFALQHSVMARRQVKSWLGRRIPKALERTSYVLATDVCLALLLVLWQPWGEQIWRVEGAVAVTVWSLSAVGWVLALTATFAIDHLELVGLRQAGWAAVRDPGGTSDLYAGGLYAVVRHPLMTGLLLAFWATPRMSASHLLFALAASGYVAVGMRFEERDLRNAFGASYDDYAARVPALLPRLPIRRGSRHSTSATIGRGETALARLGTPHLTSPDAGTAHVLGLRDNRGFPRLLRGVVRPCLGAGLGDRRGHRHLC